MKSTKSVIDVFTKTLCVYKQNTTRRFTHALWNSRSRETRISHTGSVFTAYIINVVYREVVKA